MTTDVYIVIEGGCVSFVSSTDENLRVHIVDKDDMNDLEFYTEGDIQVMEQDLDSAKKLARVW